MDFFLQKTHNQVFMHLSDVQKTPWQYVLRIARFVLSMQSDNTKRAMVFHKLSSGILMFCKIPSHCWCFHQQPKLTQASLPELPAPAGLAFSEDTILYLNRKLAGTTSKTIRLS